MGKNNFLWAVKQMQKGKKVTRKAGFDFGVVKYLRIENDNIYFCDENNLVLDFTLLIEDYLAEDWILL